MNINYDFVWYLVSVAFALIGMSFWAVFMSIADHTPDNQRKNRNPE